MDGILNLPDLAFGSSSVGRGIHDDGIVMVPSSDFALHKFDAVIHQPPDRLVGQAGRSRIFLGPAYHAFGCVYMGDAGAGGCSGQCSASGISKEI